MAELKPKKICLVRLSALGDVVLLVPLVRSIQKAFPGSEITWIIGEGAHALLQGLNGVRFLVLKKEEGFLGYWRLRQQLLEESFDILLACQASFRAHWIYPMIRAKRSIGFDSQRSKDLHGLFVSERISFSENHLLDGFLQFGKALGIDRPVIEWNLPLADSDHDFAAQKMPLAEGVSWLAINPAASKLERTWGVDRYTAVCREVIRSGSRRIVFTGGKATEEIGMTAEIIRSGGLGESDCVNLVGKTTPKQLCAVLQRASALLAPDTGPVHFARAVGTPVIGLYAVMTAKLSGPYHACEWVIDRYQEAVRQILKKDPLTIRWGTRVHDRRAMDLISVAEVMVQINRCLASRAGI